MLALSHEPDNLSKDLKVPSLFCSQLVTFKKRNDLGREIVAISHHIDQCFVAFIGCIICLNVATFESFPYSFQNGPTFPILANMKLWYGLPAKLEIGAFLEGDMKASFSIDKTRYVIAIHQTQAFPADCPHPMLFHPGVLYAG